MEIYNGPHLIITYEQKNDRFVNSWLSSPKNTKAFLNEMLQYKFALEEINPSQILWLQEGFTFQINVETKLWIEENIMKPRLEAGFISQDQDGFDHIAFVVGENVIAHMEVMGIFKEKSQSVFKPKHLATEKQARNWLNNEPVNTTSDNNMQKVEINYKGIDNNGKAIFEYKELVSKFSRTINSFKTIIEENQFIKNNIEKFSSLTLREKETLQFIIKGYSNEELSIKMNISPHTARTHRNRIWKKLKINHYNECFNYKCFFN